jgi:threonylcarbamoyladenosine tRNA methylthiotransferase MtaB
MRPNACGRDRQRKLNAMIRVYLHSIGCRTNQQEMVTLGYQLAGEGYALVERGDQAEIIVVNSCAVTARTEAKTRRAIESIARRNPSAKILVTGCLAQQQPAETLRRSGVHWVVGNMRKNAIADIIRARRGGLFCGEFSPHADTLAIPAFSVRGAAWNNRTRFPVKIQEGCSCRCTYCIVPSLRGPSRSAPADQVLGACRQAIEAGFKEIVLTGTHIGQYSGATGGLAAVLESVLSLDGDFRVRLSSLDPRELTQELTDLILARERICRHLHISVQHFSPAILRAMGRPILDNDAFFARVSLLRDRLPSLGLGGDFIVGFPGESDQQFADTRRVIQEVGFTYGHVFRYSPRPGTPAASMDGQIDESVKRERAEALREQLDRAKRAFIDRQTGRKERIIVEYESPVRGVTSNFIRVELPGRKERNSWLRVTLGHAPTSGALDHASAAESEER